MKYFTKINIMFAFNNIRIKKTKVLNRLLDSFWFYGTLKSWYKWKECDEHLKHAREKCR
jgi:hypothetical protein